jgi:hypothetical protein
MFTALGRVAMQVAADIVNIDSRGSHHYFDNRHQTHHHYHVVPPSEGTEYLVSHAATKLIPPS